MKFSHLAGLVLSWASWTSLSPLTATATVLRGNQNSTDLNSSQSPDSFPQIYTAVTPCPGIKSSDVNGNGNSNGIHFAAQVDLIEIVQRGLPSPIDGTGTDFCKIAFLVHNALEMRTIESYIATPDSARSATDNKDPTSTASFLQQDPVKTKELNDSMRKNTAEANNGERHLQTYSTISGFTCYRNIDGMLAWMQAMVVRAPQVSPNLSIQLVNIGNSYRGETMWALVITGNGVIAAGRTTEKAPMFVMTGIHAREYAPPELAARWVESLVNGYGTNADITSILDHAEIHLVIESNPDGRRLAESNQALYQRKSRHDYGNCGTSGGVDLNRNFPFMWGRNDGSSSDPCAETYRGPSAASEPEVQAISNYVRTIFPVAQRKTDPEGQLNVAYPETAKGVFIDIHSYGNMIIWPWGFQNVETPNDEGLETLVNKYMHFNSYAYSGPNTGFLYEASGATDDWAYGTLGAAGMTFEIGSKFYETCTYFNANIVLKNIGALTYAAKIASAPYSLPKGPDMTNIQMNATSVGANGAILFRPSFSDLAWSVGAFSTSKQGVQAIHTWIDVHPYDSGAGAGFVVGGLSTVSSITTGSYTMQASQYSIGRHTIYFEAIDSLGYKGPVTATYFDIGVAAPTPLPTKTPTRIPTKIPTRVPTRTPVKTPTKKPTRRLI